MAGGVSRLSLDNEELLRPGMEAEGITHLC